MMKRYGTYLFLDDVKAAELVSLGKVSLSEKIKPMPIHRKEKIAFDYLHRTRFSGEGKKIAWVQDASKLGGSELSSFETVRVGEESGFDIVGITPYNFVESVLNESEIVVVNNFFEFDLYQFNFIRDLLFEKRKVYVKYDHDFREIQRQNISRRLFREASLIVFISPLHRDTLLSTFEGDIYSTYLTLPLAINTSQVKTSTKKENSVLVPAPYKMTEETVRLFVNEHRDKQFTFVGQIPYSLDGDIRFTGKLPYGDILGLYAESQYVLHKPYTMWAGDRVYFEALLSGCEVFVNENVGHASWGFTKETIKKELYAAPYAFWKEVDSLCTFR